MKIVVVGAGEVGSGLCETLSEQGHDVTVIESSAQKASQLEEEQNIRVLEGNGSSAEILVEADVSSCDFFLAMTSEDRTNLMSCSLAKVLGAGATIARIHDQTYTDNSYVNYQLHFGIDYLLNPEGLCAVELAKAMRNSGRVAVENFARGQIEVQQVRVTHRSKIIGKPLMEIKLDDRVRVGYVQRGDELEVGKGDTIFQEDDLVTLFGDPEALFEVKPKFDPSSKVDSVKVALFGGAETSIALVRLLTNPRFKVRIIERDASICRKLAERFPQATIVHGDATSLRLLEEEQIGSVDYFVGGTKDDEDNIMTCLQASKLGARHVQLLINKPDYEQVLNNHKGTLGVEMVVSPRVATMNELLRFISEESYIELAELPNNLGKILEIRIPPESHCAGKTIREVPLPRDAVFVALLHKFQAKVPGAEDTLLAGDRVVVIVKEHHINELVSLLT